MLSRSFLIAFLFIVAMVILLTYFTGMDRIRRKQYLSNKKFRIYMDSHGRLGNHLHNFASAFGISKMNNRELVFTPRFMAKISLFLNTSFWRFPVEDIPPGVKRKQIMFARYQPNIDHLGMEDIEFGPCIQVLQYFQPYLKEINGLMRIKQDLVTDTQTLLRLWTQNLDNNVTFVGIHVRRGDFVRNMEREGGRLVPGSEYFRKAMLYFLKKYSNVHFVVCSDEIKWCMENEKYFKPEALNTNFSSGDSPAFDLALLSHCKHTISTVGTFGRWAGWFTRREVIYFEQAVAEGSGHGEDFTPKICYFGQHV